MSQPIRLQLFPITTGIENETLTLDGCDLRELADRFGTPLYLYDAATMDTAVQDYRRALQTHYPGENGITYAGKAFLAVAIAQWTQRHNLWVDCTGLGEMHVAVAAGVPRKHILIHGVNKSEAVLRAALRQAGTIVVDSLSELRRVVELSSSYLRGLNLWLRFRPGRAVETHAHIQTGQEDSKFGMSAAEIVQAAAICRQQGLPLTGLHFHLGSKFDDPAPLRQAVLDTVALAREIGLQEGWTLCIGGGWGVAYHEDALPHPSVDEYIRWAAQSVVAGCEQTEMPLPRLHVEPGRSLIARAGVAVYRVGTVKRTAHRRWLLLDGGMADNPRHALYGARYTALPVAHPGRPSAGPAWLAGPYCESGDVLIENLPFPEVEEGELIAIPVSGAYHLSMASNYNGAARPAVLWLENGMARLIRRRERPDDLIRNDLPLPDGGRGWAAIPLCKYHGLGNDYLVLRASDLSQPLRAGDIRRICDRHRGVGADGIALDVSTPDRLAVRFYNPDGSEAEISGNGLRIFARYLWDEGRIGSQPVSIETAGRSVRAQVLAGGEAVVVDMGRPAFAVVDGLLEVAGETLRYCAVDMGNPHCVVLCEQVSPDTARRLGPQIEVHPDFPNRTNVQFMQVLDQENIRIEIWERGAGYTLASGSSSCAAAAAAYRLGLCDERVTVHMPGGELEIEIGADDAITLRGPVAKAWEGRLSGEVFR